MVGKVELAVVLMMFQPHLIHESKGYNIHHACVQITPVKRSLNSYSKKLPHQHLGDLNKWDSLIPAVGDSPYKKDTSKCKIS